MSSDDRISPKDDLLSKDDSEYGNFRAAIELRRRNISQEQLDRFEAYAAEILSALGLDLHTPGTGDTLRRAFLCHCLIE